MNFVILTNILIVYFNRLNRYDFLFLADLIIQILPHEPKDLYYTLAQFGQKASGKLYDAYNNYRKNLSQCGFLKRRAYSSKTVECIASNGKNPITKTILASYTYSYTLFRRVE